MIGPTCQPADRPIGRSGSVLLNGAGILVNLALVLAALLLIHVFSGFGCALLIFNFRGIRPQPDTHEISSQSGRLERRSHDLEGHFSGLLKARPPEGVGGVRTGRCVVVLERETGTSPQATNRRAEFVYRLSD